MYMERTRLTAGLLKSLTVLGETGARQLSKSALDQERVDGKQGNIRNGFTI